LLLAVLGADLVGEAAVRVKAEENGAAAVGHEDPAARIYADAHDAVEDPSIGQDGPSGRPAPALEGVSEGRARKRNTGR
jgi:hypothetical protein